MTHPSFGPVPPEEFKRAEAAPFGEATKMIRKYDPAFGRADGDKRTFAVKVTRTVLVTEHATEDVEAFSSDEAEEIVRQMHSDREDFDWNREYGSEEPDDFWVDSAEEVSP